VLEIGLMRSNGMTLPGNGCPVSGSRITAPPEKSPARCAADSTVRVSVMPCLFLKPSK
jgi:hypothetical protein